MNDLLALHSVRFTTIRIVLVDDQPIMREGLARRFEQEADMEVVGLARDPDEARPLIENQNPDLVILDLHSPGDAGLAVVDRIRRVHPEAKILVLAGEARAVALDAALVAGVRGFLSKSEASEKLLQAVRDVAAGLIRIQSAASQPTDSGAGRASVIRRPSLSRSELSVLKGLAEGLSYKELADRLQVTVKCIEYYRATLVRKTGRTTRAELVRYAVRLGLVSL